MKTSLSVFLAAVSSLCLADYRTIPFEKKVQYGPLKPLAPVQMSFRDGMMLKNGKPHYWIGNGDADAASQQGHSAIWLAWLQGADIVTLNHGMQVDAKRGPDGTVEVWDNPDLGIQSWRREAIRLGVACNFFHSHEPDTGGQTCSPQAYRLSLEDPALHEIYYHLGHHLGFDTGSDEGLAFSLNHRKALYDYLDDAPMASYMEIAREPGANPNNSRVREGFRAWAKAKYAGDLAAADAVWGVKHSSWDEVVPPHLDKERFPAKQSYEDILMRNRARNEAPNFYADWFLYLQQDTERMLGRELSSLRKLAPWAPVTVDVRGHTSRDDSYAALVPERISPLVDLFSIHYGTTFFDFAGRPWDRASVLATTDTGLMWESYFRVNTTGAIVNSENIFHDARSPMSDIDRMRENDLGQLCAQKWRISRDGPRSYHWMKPDFDDSKWAEITVPGCWDHERGTEFEGFRGTCWLRRTFTVPGQRKQDFVDGSCVFRLIGKGVAQQGDVWLNGHKLNQKKVTGWSTPYSFDVGAFINWGGRNVLVWRVDGADKSDNGLRFPSYILTDDQLSKPTPFNGRMCRFMNFQHLMGGLSGNWMWHWHHDGVRTFQPQMKAQLNAIAGTALSAIRNRRSRIAYLFAYNNGPGLVFGGDARNYVDFFDAFVFAGETPDAYGEEIFRRDVTPGKYPLLVVPMTPCVDPATYEHFKRYVAAGGTAIVTDGTFLRTTTRHQATDFEDYLKKGDFGKGKVVVFSSKDELKDLIGKVREYMPEQAVRVAADSTGEIPLIERVFVGEGDERVLYLANWGGMDHSVGVRLPEEYAGWQVTDVVGRFGRHPSGKGFVVRVPSQDVAAAILTRPGKTPRALPRVSPLRQAKLDEIARIYAKARAVAPEKADVLFVGAVAGKRGARSQGIEKHPEIVRVLELLGLTYSEVQVSELKAGQLANTRLVIVAEANSNGGIKADANAKGPMVGVLADYVRRGGSLMALTDSAGTRNCNALLLRNLSSAFGLGRAKCCSPMNAEKGSFGDPFQIVSTDIPASPFSAGVKSVQLYKHQPIAFRSSRQLREAGIVASPAVGVEGGLAMAAGTCEKGRFFISADISAFAPFRIEHGDNAALLVNVLGWLVGKPVDDALRTKVRENLFLTEADLQKILADEQSR